MPTPGSCSQELPPAPAGTRLSLLTSSEACPTTWVLSARDATARLGHPGTPAAQTRAAEMGAVRDAGTGCLPSHRVEARGEGSRPAS